MVGKTFPAFLILRIWQEVHGGEWFRAEVTFVSIWGSYPYITLVFYSISQVFNLTILWVLWATTSVIIDSNFAISFSPQDQGRIIFVTRVPARCHFGVRWCHWYHGTSIRIFVSSEQLDIIDNALANSSYHDDVNKWKHFLRNWPFVRGIDRSPVNSPHEGRWRRALMFSVICVWINDWVNNREAGDLRRYRAHYDASVMFWQIYNHTPNAQSNYDSEDGLFVGNVTLMPDEYLNINYDIAMPDEYFNIYKNDVVIPINGLFVTGSDTVGSYDIWM